MSKYRLTGIAGLLLALMSGTAAKPAAAESLTVYCSVLEEWCQAMVNAFTKSTGIDVAMTRKSTGETYAQIKAEANNPKGDIWWGGPGDPHLQAAEEGLTVAYESLLLKDLHPWAVNQWKQTRGRTVGIYAGALGFTYNEELLKKRNLPAPACWSDLLKPEYKQEIQIANPNSSGTSYTALATIVQLFGEESGFDYLKQLHANVNQYTKSGVAPANAASRGETLIGIGFMHDGIALAINGFPVKVVAPCEGTGNEIGSMSLIKGARNMDAAKKWYDWALTPEAQALGAAVKAYPVPSNKYAPVPPHTPSLDEVKLIDYNFQKYGASAERQRLLARWDKEIGAIAH